MSKELVKELYNNENFEILITIFHELIHTMQWKEIFTSKDIKAITPLMMTELMEYILTREASGYYNENYDKISYKNEANSSGLYILYLYFNKINFNYYNGEIFKKRMEYC